MAGLAPLRLPRRGGAGSPPSFTRRPPTSAITGCRNSTAALPATRRYQAGPAEYPVSCSPQAWAAAAPVLLLQSLLGLQPLADLSGVTVGAHLPPWLRQIHIENLLVGNRRLTVTITRPGMG